MMKNLQQLEQETDQLRQQVSQLQDESKRDFYQRWERQVKDPDSYAVLNYLFITGLHHFYLGKWGRGAINLGLFVFSILLALGGAWQWGLGLWLVVVVLELPALMRSQHIVLDHNNRRMRKLLAEYQN